MGTIHRDKNVIWFEYVLPNENKVLTRPEKKVTMRNIIEKEEGKVGVHKIDIATAKELKLPKLEKKFLQTTPSGEKREITSERKNKIIHDDKQIKVAEFDIKNN